MKPLHVLFVGYGKIGSAIEHVITKAKGKNVSIEVWDIDPAKAKKTDLAVAVPKADVIFLTLPSWAIAEAATEIKPYLQRTITLVSVSKGLDQRTDATIDVLVQEAFPRQPFALCFGPMLADELLRGQVGAATVASKNAHVREVLQRLFAGTALSIETTTDVRGTALCGVLKNVYALGLGILDGLDAGSNRKGMYVQQAFDEMERIIVRLGGKKDAIRRFAGIGDFIATGFSDTSKNVQYGQCLAEGKAPDFICEGSASMNALKRDLGVTAKELPLFSLLHAIVCKKKEPKVLLNA